MNDRSLAAEADHIARLCDALAVRATSAGWADVQRALDELPTTLRVVRDRERLSLRDVAASSGVALASLHRFEHGGDVSFSNVRLLVRWLVERSGGEFSE